MTTGTLPPLPPDDDEVAVPHFEDALLAALLDEQRSGRGTAVPATRRSPDRRFPDRRSRDRRRVLVAAVALAVAGAALTALALGGEPTETVYGSRGDDTTRSSVSPEEEAEAQARLAAARARVTPEAEAAAAAIEAALDASIVHEATGGREAWYDRTGGAARHLQYDVTGAIERDWGWTVPPGRDDDPDEPQYDAVTRTVDHCLRTTAVEEGTLMLSEGIAWSVRDRLLAGTLLLGDVVEVDGRPLTRLEDNSDLDEAPPAGEGVVDEVAPPTYYLDAAMLPVLVDMGDLRTTIEYLPHTPETQALLTPPVPAGFATVDEPAVDEERLGCPPAHPEAVYGG